MNQVYAPGCALMLYKPHLAEKIRAFLDVPEHLICCRHQPELPQGTQIINTCPGCDERFGRLYEGITTISLWEILAQSQTFPFPDYHGSRMTLHDACPTRGMARVHNAVRVLLQRMNIELVEPPHTREHSICCGDSFYPACTAKEIETQMKKRADEMPCQDVVVYCVSCVKAMHIGGKKPRHIVDLLFDEPTDAGVYQTEAWHALLNAFIETH